jgi:hypothetical protein
MDLKRGIDKAGEAVVAELREEPTPVHTPGSKIEMSRGRLRLHWTNHRAGGNVR